MRITSRNEVPVLAFALLLCGGSVVALSGVPTRAADAGLSYTNIDTELGKLPAPKKHYKFAYVSKTLINEFWQAVKVGADAAAAKDGVTVDTQAAKDESSLTEQLNIAQTMLSGGYDALLISPQSDSNLGPAIEQAKAKGIPVIDIDDARATGVSTYIGTDQVAIGMKAAQYIVSKLPQGGEVAQIEGQAGSPNARARIKGFKQGVDQSGKLKLVASQPGNWDRLTALDAAATIIRAHPDVKAFYANNDTMALGVVEAVRNANMTGKIIVVGTDGIGAAKKSIADGQLDATVAEFPVQEGQLGVEMAIRQLEGQKLPAWIISQQAVITKDNVSKFP
jgi:ribose transport system substrate-binding protein